MSSEQKEENKYKHIGKLKYSDEIIDKHINFISLIPPKTALELYNEELYAFSSNSVVLQNQLKLQYLNLPIEKRNLYINMEKKEKERFSMELQLLKKYLLPEYYKEGKSAQEIFIEEYSNNILNNKKSLNREEIEKEANIKWNEMNEKEKAEWNELQKENEQLNAEVNNLKGKLDVINKTNFPIIN